MTSEEIALHGVNLGASALCGASVVACLRMFRIKPTWPFAGGLAVIGFGLWLGSYALALVAGR